MRLFMSGGENTKHAEKMIGGGATNILCSYYYLKRKKGTSPWIFDNIPKGGRILIDSGAHTIKQGDISEGDQKIFYGKYVEEYLNWAHKNQDKIFAIVELDIEESTSLELVEWLQKTYFYPFEKLHPNILVCYVWHEPRGFKGWTEMCKKHRYVGLGGNLPLSRYRAMITTATKYKALVHGFAMTKPDVMVKANFYSVDSTRWLTGEQYGCTFIWSRTHMIEFQKDDKSQRKRYKKYYQKLGLNFKNIIADDRFELGKANVAAWVGCETFVNKRTLRKQWWNEENLLTIKNGVATIGLKVAEIPSNPVDDQVLPIDNVQKDQISAAENESLDNNTQEERDKNLKEQGNIENIVKTIINDTEVPDITKANTTKGCPLIGKNKNSTNIVPLSDKDRQTSIDKRRKEVFDTALICDNCYAADSCGEFKEGAVCSLRNEFKRLKSTNSRDCINKIKEIISELEERAWQNRYFEKLDGGIADKNVTSLMDDLIGYQKMLADLMKESAGVDKITLSGEDVLSRIFSNKPNVPKADIIEAELEAIESTEPPFSDELKPKPTQYNDNGESKGVLNKIKKRLNENKAEENND